MIDNGQDANGPESLEELSTEGPSQEEIISAFTGQIPLVETTLFYRLGLFFVAIVMILLPMVYLGLILGVGYIGYTYWLKLTMAYAMGFWSFWFYLFVMLVCSVLVLFMIKPLFARWPEQAKPAELLPEDEPLLFAFVEKICRVVRAPVPKRIYVGCEVNAAAGFREGFRGFLQGELVLTIGLPLVAALNLSQMAGVLSHEFGHFSQSMGMRLTYLVRSINLWFTRVVYERDALDEILLSWYENSDWLFALLLAPMLFLIWLTRKVLLLLMLVGHGFSCFLMRQMEYDADRYEHRLVGAEVFERTVHKLQLLSAGSILAHAHLIESWRDGRLGDNLPTLIVEKIKELPLEILDEIKREVMQRRTRLFDTHPSEFDRILSARKENSGPGIFQHPESSSVLFQDFEKLSVEVTFDYYRDTLGDAVQKDNILPTALLLQQQKQIEEGEKALIRYFQGVLSSIRPPCLEYPVIQPIHDTAEAVDRLLTIRNAMEREAESLRCAIEVYEQADTKILLATQAETLLGAGLVILGNEYDLLGNELEDALYAISKGEEVFAKEGATLASFERMAGERLYRAFQILGHQDFSQTSLAKEYSLSRVERISEILVLCRHSFPMLMALRKWHVGLMTLARRFNEFYNFAGFIEQFQFVLEQAYQAMLVFYKEFARMDYPFEHAKASITIAEYFLEEIPDANNFAVILGVGEEMMARYQILYSRCMGELVLVAEKIEAELGWTPLPCIDNAESYTPQQQAGL